MKSLKKHFGIHTTNALLVDLHSFTTYTYMVKLLRVFSHCRFQCWKLLMHVNSMRHNGLKIEKSVMKMGVFWTETIKIQYHATKEY